MRNTITGRIERVLYGLKPKELAMLTGLDKRYIKRLLADECDNPEEHLEKIANALGVNDYWLRTGEGNSAAGAYDFLEVEIDKTDKERIKKLLREILYKRVDKKAKTDMYREAKFCCNESAVSETLLTWMMTDLIVDK